METFEDKIKNNAKMCHFYTGFNYPTIQSILSYLCIIEGVTPITY